MRALLLVCFFVGMSAAAVAQRAIDARHSRVRIYAASDAERAMVAAMDMDHAHAAGDAIVAVLTHADVARLRDAGVRVDVDVEELERYYADRIAGDAASAVAAGSALSLAPSNFSLGSVGGHLSPEEISEQLARMSALYPHLAGAPEQIGTSHQGRPIIAIRLSARPSTDTLAGEALYTALHHAREPTGMMSLFYTMWSLLEGYGVDAESTYLLDHRALWFVPLVNPDGYAQNIRAYPNGGGLWRRNMRAAGDSGVDLNRNYGPAQFWAHPVGGSSDNHNADNYRGPAPFSEPETQAVRDFCLRRRFAVALNYHTFGNLLIQPEEVLDLPSEDSLYYRTATRALGALAALAPGSSVLTVGYATRGTSDDWLYAYGRRDDGHVFSWTPEAGSGADEFWPTPARVAAISAWNHRMNLGLAWAAGAAPMITARGWRSTPTGLIARATVLNAGRQPMTSPATLSLVGSSSVQVPALAPGEALDFDLPVSDTVLGTRAARRTLSLTLSFDGVELRDSVMPIVHALDTLFADDFESGLGSWRTGVEWGSERVDGSTVASDSPGALYTERRGEDNVLEMSVPLSLAGYAAAELAFSASYSVEARNHRAGVQVRREGSLVWEDVDAVELQAPFESSATTRNRFRGDGSAWLRYAMPLDAFLGSSISIRFFVSARISQFGRTFDGVKLDDVEVVAARPVPSAVGDDEAARDVRVSPNPFSAALIVQLPADVRIATGSVVALYDALGRLVRTRPAAARTVFDTQSLPQGAYTLVVYADGRAIRTRVALVR